MNVTGTKTQKQQYNACIHYFSQSITDNIRVAKYFNPSEPRS